jgi:nucleotide-binding universal stress UspA family protein
MNIKTILQPNDFSVASRHAFELACSLARDHGARVVVLNVIDVPFDPGEGGVPCSELTDRRAEAQHLLSKLIKPRGDVAVERMVTAGEPVSEIIRVAAEKGADLIALGTHGKTGVHRWLMGSVAENVLRRAPCPVLAAKRPIPDEADLAPRRAVPTNMVASPC